MNPEPRINPPDDGFQDWYSDHEKVLILEYEGCMGMKYTHDVAAWDYFVLCRWNDHIDMVEAGGDPDRFRDDV